MRSGASRIFLSRGGKRERERPGVDMAAPATHAPSVAAAAATGAGAAGAGAASAVATGAVATGAGATGAGASSLAPLYGPDATTYVTGAPDTLPVPSVPSAHGIPVQPDDAMISLWPSRFIGPEYVPMLEDIARMVCIQITIQLMFYLNGAGAQQFFTPDFVMLVMYIVLGVMLYWLVFRRVIALH